MGSEKPASTTKELLLEAQYLIANDRDAPDCFIIVGHRLKELRPDCTDLDDEKRYVLRPDGTITEVVDLPF